MGEAMLLCAPDTRSGMCRDSFAFLICTSHLPRYSNSLSLSLSLFYFPQQRAFILSSLHALTGL